MMHVDGSFDMAVANRTLNDVDFIEDHTALSDAQIEVAILAECFRQKKAVPYGKINGSPWRLVNKNAGDDLGFDTKQTGCVP